MLWEMMMKIIEMTCDKCGKHDAGALFTKKEREIIYQALKQHSEKHKRRTTTKKLLNYWYKHMPV